jgi:hypothetical protein
MPVMIIALTMGGNAKESKWNRESAKDVASDDQALLTDVSLEKTRRGGVR